MVASRSTSEVHGLPAARLLDRHAEHHRQPGHQLPFGRLETGLPFGLQITAPHFHDYRLLDIASDIESAFPWARTAPGYEPLDSLLEHPTDSRRRLATSAGDRTT